MIEGFGGVPLDDEPITRSAHRPWVRSLAMLAIVGIVGLPIVGVVNAARGWWRENHRPDPCALLTADQMAAAVGGPTTPAPQALGMHPNSEDAGPMCVYPQSVSILRRRAGDAAAIESVASGDRPLGTIDVAGRPVVVSALERNGRLTMADGSVEIDGEPIGIIVYTDDLPGEDPVERLVAVARALIAAN